MADQRQRPATTEDERLRIHAYAHEARLTHKAIAKEVFGDERYCARVARVVRAIPRRKLPHDDELV